MEHDHKRGKIKDNALKALVTSPTFRTRVERKKKGKGSYSRKAKHNAKYFGSDGRGVSQYDLHHFFLVNT